MAAEHVIEGPVHLLAPYDIRVALMQEVIRNRPVYQFGVSGPPACSDGDPVGILPDETVTDRLIAQNIFLKPGPVGRRHVRDCFCRGRNVPCKPRIQLRPDELIEPVIVLLVLRRQIELQRRTAFRVVEEPGHHPAARGRRLLLLPVPCCFRRCEGLRSKRVVVPLQCAAGGRQRRNGRVVQTRELRREYPAIIHRSA